MKYRPLFRKFFRSLQYHFVEVWCDFKYCFLRKHFHNSGGDVFLNGERIGVVRDGTFSRSRDGEIEFEFELQQPDSACDIGAFQQEQFDMKAIRK